MSSSTRPPYPVPPSPRVISPSPTPSDTSGKDDYFPPTTRSRSSGISSEGSLRMTKRVEPIEEDADDYDNNDDTIEEDPELSRARSRRRSSQIERARGVVINNRSNKSNNNMTGTNGSIVTATTIKTTAGKPSTTKSKTSTVPQTPQQRKKIDANSKTQLNGNLLSPDSAYGDSSKGGPGFGAAYWRSLSRSPSPFGLIPIHREWRAFVHKHEVPRKALHVSIGFMAIWLYESGIQPTQIHPVLLGLLVPIFSADLLRFRWQAFNDFYIRTLGALMRESEAHDRFNGVISYLAGLWVTARFCRKDVFVLSVLLLSWCDTAASTFGRLWGKYTPRIRRGKSLAGSIAAFTFGVGAAVLFWGFLAPRAGGELDVGVNRFAFQGELTLPAPVREVLGLGEAAQARIEGPLAVGVMGVVCGLVASVSEAIDVFGLDDNLTIPVLCGLGLGGFLWAFGSR